MAASADHFEDLSNLARSVPEGLLARHGSILRGHYPLIISLRGNMEPSRPAKLLLANRWVNMPNGLYIGLDIDLYSLVN